MTNSEAIRILESMKDELILAFDHDRKEALSLAISALQAQYSKCDTCKHDPPEMDKWPCMDCDMREHADRWEAQDVPDTNVGDMVSRRFVELLAEYHDPELCPYKEYKGKPYFSIKYIENGEEYVGYGTYSPKVMSRYLREYFMVTAQPDLPIKEKCAFCPHCNNCDVNDDLSIQPCMDTISRQAALDCVTYDVEYTTECIKALPPAQPDNHEVACLLAELFGDTCACNFNDIDEWLPEKCEFLDACPDPGGVTCWEQFLKHRAERKDDE